MGITTTKKVNKPLEARLKDLGDRAHTVKVGVFGDEATKKHGKVNNLYIAQVHEFGAPEVGIPERSFLRSTARTEAKKIAKEQELLLQAYLKGKVTMKAALAILGESIVNKVRRKIKAGIEPALKPATIKRKGSSTPLIDTGQLINSIAYQVEEGPKK